MRHFRKILIVVLLYLPALGIKAQTPMMTGSPHGVYLEFGELSGTEYHLLRADGKSNNFQPLGSFTLARSSSELHQRMSENAAIFKENTLPPFRLADTLWNIWSSPEAYKILELRVPIIHLSLGISYLDTNAVVGKDYRYRLLSESGENLITTGTYKYELKPAEFAPIQNILIDEGESIPRIEWSSPLANAAMQIDIWRSVRGSSAPFQNLYIPIGITANATADSVIYSIKDTTAQFGIRYDYFLTGRDMLDNIGTSSDTVSLQVGGRRNITAAFNMWTQAVDDGIHLTWEPLKQQYSLQNIVVLRSDKYESDYQMVATLPVTDTTYTDYAVRPGKRYFYQLLIQGESNFSMASPRISGIYYGLVRLLPPQNVAVYIENESPVISWNYSDTTDIRGFYIYRTFSTSLPLEQLTELLPVSNSFYNYTDTTRAEPGTTAYYTIAAVSKTQSLGPASQVVSISMPARKDIRTPTTSQLSSIWLDNNRVSITWEDISQTAFGVAGYKVYKKETEDDEFPELPVFETRGNEFTDTLKAGESRIYAVRVEGIDGVLSAFSPSIQLEAAYPRLLPPGNFRLFHSDNNVLLVWDASSEQSGVSHYIVYRSEGNQPLKQVGTVKNEGLQLQYNDTKLKKNTVYYYTISSVNVDGHESEQSEELFVQTP